VNNQPHRTTVTRTDNHFKFGRPERVALPLPPIDSNLDISADGRFVAQAMFFRAATILDRQTGKTLTLGPQQDVRHVALHPDGSLLAAFCWGGKGFRLWDTATGKLLHAHDQGHVVNGRFTPDGKHLLTRSGGVPDIELWSVPDCKLVRKLGPHAEFDVSPDGRILAAAEGRGKVRLMQIDTGEVIARFDVPDDDYLADIRFSPDGRYLFGMSVERTKHHVWDLWKLRGQLGVLNLDWESTPPPEALVDRTPLTVDIAPAAKID
jgi:WD40 repeat protein